MARASFKNLVGHWHKGFEDFETSPREFYASVEAALKAKDIRGFRTKRVLFSETGPLGAKREYLRILWRRLSCDVCAAPFGNSFFFSWWLARRPPTWWGVLLAFLSFAWLTIQAFGHLYRFYRVTVSHALHQYQWFRWRPDWVGTVELAAIGVSALLVVFLLFSLAARLGWHAPDWHLQAVPAIGWLYGTLFSPLTYYWLDTDAAFQSAAEQSIAEAINQVRGAKGLRALSEEERKPIFLELVGRGRTPARAA